MTSFSDITTQSISADADEFSPIRKQYYNYISPIYNEKDYKNNNIKWQLSQEDIDEEVELYMRYAKTYSQVLRDNRE